MLNVAFCFDEVEREQVEDVFDFLSDTLMIGHEAAILHYYEFVRQLSRQLQDVKIIISQNRYLRLISSDSIRFIEIRKRIVTIHTKEQSFETYASLQEAEYRLGDLGFFRVHRYYLVSHRHIVLVGKTELLLDTGEKIPVGRAYRENVKLFLANEKNIRI